MALANQAPDALLLATGMTLVDRSPAASTCRSARCSALCAARCSACCSSAPGCHWPAGSARRAADGRGLRARQRLGHRRAGACPSFIVTLAMLEMARGATYLVTHSQTLYLGARVDAISVDLVGRARGARAARCGGGRRRRSSSCGAWCSAGRSSRSARTTSRAPGGHRPGPRADSRRSRLRRAGGAGRRGAGRTPVSRRSQCRHRPRARGHCGRRHRRRQPDRRTRLRRSTSALGALVIARARRRARADGRAGAHAAARRPARSSSRLRQSLDH